MQPATLPPLLADLVREVTASHPVGTEMRLARFLASVLAWNRRVSLVSRADPDRAIHRLVLQSIEMKRVAQQALGAPPDRVVDLGSGAGFPGIVWAILAAPVETVLVERRIRKASFLERTVAALDLPCGVLGRDLAERHGMLGRGGFDCGTALAVGPPSVTVPLLSPYIAPQGVVVTTIPRSSPRPGAAPPGWYLAEDSEAGTERTLAFRRAENRD